MAKRPKSAGKPPKKKATKKKKAKRRIVKIKDTTPVVPPLF